MTTDETPPTFDDLNRFQVDILFIIEQAEDALHGLGIKERLEDEYNGKEVYHGRLYPSLNGLVELGLVSKEAVDDRTNRYVLTEDGTEWVASRRAFVTPETTTDSE